MDLLQLIFSVLAGFGAGAIAALYVGRPRDPETDVGSTSIDDLQRRAAEDREEMRRLTELWVSDRDVRKRLQKEVRAQDTYVRGLEAQIKRLEHSHRSNAGRPHQRLEVRLDDTAGRLGSVESGLDRLERRIHSKLIAFREGTQDVLRKLADHQVGEAERVTYLFREQDGLRQRLDAKRPRHRDTDTHLVDLSEAQADLTSRTAALELRVEQSLEQLERYLATIESQLESPKDQAQPAKKKAKRAPKPKAEGLERLVGVGPKLAAQLRAHGVADIDAMAQLSATDIDRLSDAIRGFRDRHKRHDWIGQAQRMLPPNANAQPAEAAAASTREAEPAAQDQQPLLDGTSSPNAGWTKANPSDDLMPRPESAAGWSASDQTEVSDASPRAVSSNGSRSSQQLVPPSRRTPRTPPGWPVPTLAPESPR